MNNSIGHIFRLTTFGESHGPALGGIIDGMPAGIKIDTGDIQRALDRRRPGQSDIVTQRNEPDKVTFLSGILDDGTTTGTPIGFIIPNTNQHSADYSEMAHVFRPSHADYTYQVKYGIRDYRGGGRASARETAARVVAGAIALQALASMGITIYAYTSRVGDISLVNDYRLYNPALIDSNPVRCPDSEKAAMMQQLIMQVKNDGDTIGGIISCVAKGVPAGTGSPIFGKLQAELAHAMLSIPAAKGFDYGMGFDGCSHRGSEMIDALTTRHDGSVTTRSNNSGGIQGGIANGEDIYMRIAFKPVATILRDVETIDDKGRNVRLKARGRHDPCVLPRAVPVVEAMAAITILDQILLDRTTRISHQLR